MKLVGHLQAHLSRNQNNFHLYSVDSVWLGCLSRDISCRWCWVTPLFPCVMYARTWVCRIFLPCRGHYMKAAEVKLLWKSYRMSIYERLTRARGMGLGWLIILCFARGYSSFPMLVWQNVLWGPVEWLSRSQIECLKLLVNTTMTSRTRNSKPNRTFLQTPRGVLCESDLVCGLIMTLPFHIEHRN